MTTHRASDGDAVRRHAQREKELRAREESAAAAFAAERRRLTEDGEEAAAREAALQQKVITLLEDKTRLETELAAAPDLRAAVRAHEEDAQLARRDAAAAQQQLSDHRRQAAEERATQQRHAERLEQEAADERCKVAILEHRLAHAAAKAAQHDTVTGAVQRRADRCTAAVDEAAAKDEELRHAAGRHAQERQLLDAKLTAAREARSTAEEGLGYAQKALEQAERRAYRQRGLLQQAMWALATAEAVPPPSDIDNHTAVQRFLDKHSGAAQEPRGTATEPSTPRAKTPQRRSIVMSSLPATDDPVAEGTARLQRLLGAVPQDRAPALIRRFCDCAVANDPSRRAGAGSFGVASGLPPPDEEPTAIVAQLAAVTKDRDLLLADIVKLRRDKGDGSLGGTLYM